MHEGTFPTYPIQTEQYVTRLVFNPERINDLRTGARCLDEVIKNQVQAIEDAERAKREAIANQKAAITKVWSERERNIHRTGFDYLSNASRSRTRFAMIE